MRDPDWKRIREEYITEDISYRAIAKKWDVPFNTLKDRAKREMWFSKRQRYREDLYTDTIQAVREHTTRTDADRLLKLREAADGLTDIVNAVLTESDSLKRAFVDEDGRPTYKYDVRSVKELAGTLKDLVLTVKALEERTQGGGGAGGVIILPARGDA